MDVASLLLGIGSLFPICAQGYKVLSSVKSFPKDTSALYWKLKTQELRFTAWGQAYGLKEDAEGSDVQIVATAYNVNHSLRGLELTHEVLLAMQKTLSDVDTLGLQRRSICNFDPRGTTKCRFLCFAVRFLQLLTKSMTYGLYKQYPRIRKCCGTQRPSKPSISSFTKNNGAGLAGALRLEISFSALQFLESEEELSGDGRCLAQCRQSEYGPPQTVLVEWKYYEQNLHIGSSPDPTLQRIHRLAQLLGQRPKPMDFRVLDCIGYAHDRVRARVGIIFSLPNGSPASVSLQRGTLTPKAWISLHDLIEQLPKLPLLGNRIQLALTLLKSIIQLHSTGWLHKGFQSRNVIFFLSDCTENGNDRPHMPTKRESAKLPVNLRDPKLVGFEYSRPSSNAKTPTTSGSGSTATKPTCIPTYRASSFSYRGDLEISPTHRFKALYDLFSLGCVLLEIGLWRRLTGLWKPEYRDQIPTNWTNRLCQKYVPELGGRCGEMYQRVVGELLSYGYGETTPSRGATMTNFELLQLLESIRT